MSLAGRISATVEREGGPDCPLPRLVTCLTRMSAANDESRKGRGQMALLSCEMDTAGDGFFVFFGAPARGGLRDAESCREIED
jgi:hypothetical protein